jgi:HlyD family secretion protein
MSGKQEGGRVWLRRGVWLVAIAAIVVMLALAFRPAPMLVDAASVSRGPLSVTVDDDGYTRVRERYTISAPLPGRLLRPPLEPGDVVTAGETVVAEFVPAAPDPLDLRARAQAVAGLERARAALREAEARREQARADREHARTQVARARQLHDESVVSTEALDAAETDDLRTRAGLRAADVAVQVAHHERDLAEASLLEAAPGALDETERRPVAVDPEGAAGGSVIGEGAAGGSGSPAVRRLQLRSPIDGRVLRVLEESTRTLPAGTHILEVGNTTQLEIVADYLTQDAVHVLPGMSVRVRGWGGRLPDGSDRVLEARVRVVEPAGFTKVSALGVEEQRVNIVVDPMGEVGGWQSLADGYRVELSIVIWEGEDLLTVPTGALFREGSSWAVFVVDGDEALLRTVELGRRNGLSAEVRAGLEEGERVILYPSDLVEGGSRVVVRGD